MTAYIVNAAPMVIQQGTKDLSGATLPREAESVPQHLPKLWIYAQKGPDTPQLVSGVERDLMYGSVTFDLRSRYANHATVFANLFNTEGNACMLQRIIPDDAGPEANITLWLDVLETTVDVYARNPDGSVTLDALGSPVITGTTAGYKVKWVTTTYNTAADLELFGQQGIKPGNQADAVTGTQSVRYPIFELKVSSRGQHGNNVGIRLWAPNYKSTQNIPGRLMKEARTYPYFVSVVRRRDERSSGTVVNTIRDDIYTTVGFKPGALDPSTDAQTYMPDVLLDNYQNLTDVRYPKLYGDFGSMAIYQENLDLLLEKFHTAEIPYIDSNYDFTSDPEDKYLFNIVSGRTSQNTPYTSLHYVLDGDSVRFSENSIVYARSGSDGTMNDAAFATAVSAQVTRYLDPNDSLQELAVNVESIVYDSGFPLQTKYDLCSFIGQRKDTFVLLSTYEAGQPPRTASEEHSIAVALRTRLQMYPESDIFGTPVMRGMVIGYSGKLRNSQYKDRLPLSAAVAIKAARYMGASNGSWKNGNAFDMAPGSVIDSMYDISIDWIPASVRNRNWDVGLNWVQAYDRRSYFFPALKTVYADDTSVLNSFFTAMAICQLNKIAHAAWREFSGVSHLKNTQLIQRLNDFVAQRTANRFDNRFVIVADAFISDMDAIRGYSYTLPIKIFSANMKTVMTTYVEAERLDPPL